LSEKIMLVRKETAIAAKLIEVYFQVFSDVLKRIEVAGEPSTEKSFKKKKEGKKDLAAKAALEEEADSKILAAVLTGVNRAFPFADLEDSMCVYTLCFLCADADSVP
jgi:ribosome biogenesis protein MAK21